MVEVTAVSAPEPVPALEKATDEDVVTTGTDATMIGVSPKHL